VIVSAVSDGVDIDVDAVKVPVQLKLRIEPISLFESTTNALDATHPPSTTLR
jgi:hypothetical protein